MAKKSYTGVLVVNVSSELIDKIYKNKKLLLTDELALQFLDRTTLFENQFIYLKANDTFTKKAALCRLYKNYLYVIKEKTISGLKPRNKEQVMALDILTDDRVPIVLLTGKAGVGKTLLSLAAALDGIDRRVYSRIILTKPMSWVGKHSLGALPGDVDEKFMPYLENYMCNIECLTGFEKIGTEHLLKQYNIEMIPLQLIRGASWHKSFIIADECQVLDHHEMVTLGTRLGEGSKIIIMGDLAQRDEKIAKEKTGIYKLVNDEKAKNSELIATIELIKGERSPASELIAEIFGAI
jgi:PhoH-like ATPase